MPIVDYATLKEAVLSFLGRPDDPLIPVDTLVQLFYADANRKLKTRQQETSTTIDIVAGQASYDLPEDFLEVRYAKLMSTNPVGLEYMTPDQIDEHWPFNCGGTSPVNYTIEGVDQIRFAPTSPATDEDPPPDPLPVAWTVLLNYWKKIPTLSEENTTDFLITDYSDLVLMGTLAEAELFLGSDTSDARFSAFISRREAIYQSIKLADRQSRMGSAPLVMRTSGPTP